MKNNDDLVLEQLYQEGIWDRLKGQGAGIKQGAGTILKNVGGKLTGDKGERPSARAEYAKAQQSSLLKSFTQKVQKEIADFKEDLKVFKVDSNPDSLQKNFPIIAQRLKEIENLERFLVSPTQTAATQSAKPSTAQAVSSAETPETPKVTTNVQNYLNIKDAAEYLKVSETELQNKAATGKIKSTIIGGKALFKKEDLDGLNKPEEQQKTPTSDVEVSKTVSDENAPQKGDKVTYLNDPNYVFNGNTWEYKGKEVSGEKLITNLNKTWQQQKTMKAKPATSKPKVAAAKTAPKKVVAKPKVTAKKTNIKTNIKTAPKTTKQTPPKKAAIKPRRVVNASYNPFGEFLKECNLI
jgi:excisionase family DNA binding protein